MRGPHDVGGMTAGPIDTEPHKLTFWEKQIDAIHTLLGDDKRRLISRDENRAAIEALGNDAYSRLTYYERWTAAISLQLVKKGMLTQDEIDAKLAEITQRLEDTGELE